MFIGFLPSVGRLEGTLDRASDISRKKKAKFRRVFRGKFAEKSADFAGKKVKIRGTIGQFRGRKVKIHRKISRFHGILAEKSHFSKEFSGANF